jgi:transposase-like protein
MSLMELVLCFESIKKHIIIKNVIFDDRNTKEQLIKTKKYFPAPERVL